MWDASGRAACVAELCEALGRSVHESRDPALVDITLNDEAIAALTLAAKLHGYGQLFLPEWLRQKQTKLDGTLDRIELIRLRMELRRRDVLAHYAESMREPHADTALLARQRDEALQDLAADLAFLEHVNRGTQRLLDGELARLKKLASTEITVGATTTRLITDAELALLSAREGIYSDEERRMLASALPDTIAKLEALPLPSHLSALPATVAGQRERMDGKGDPRGIAAAQLPITARIMAVACAFEELLRNAGAKPLSEILYLLATRKRDSQLDPLLVNLFLHHKLYLPLATRLLPAAQLDTPDEATLLAMRPLT